MNDKTIVNNSGVMNEIFIRLAVLLGLAAGAACVQSAESAAWDVLVPLGKVPLSPSYGSVVELKNGTLLWVWAKSRDAMFGNSSSDGGATWSDPLPLFFDNGQPMPGGAPSQVRLKSGAIGMVVGGNQKIVLHISRDEGKTWSQGVAVAPESVDLAFANDRALVLASGRVVLPVYTRVQGPKTPVRKPPVRRFGEEFDTAWAQWMMYSYVYYSDDEGSTWKRSGNEVFITLEKGTKGIYAAQEPAVADLADGGLIMLIRTNLGRLYRSYSTDQGATWLEAEPTSLSGPAAACHIRRIPGTDDLLAIWNQVSSFEEMQGLYRHRLSCAISTDGGLSWTNRRNLESLDDTTTIENGDPEAVLFGHVGQPVDRKRYFRAPGPLRASQATCTFIKGKAVITYGLSTLGEKETITGTYGMDYDAVVRKLGLGPAARANKVRVIPLEWFYEK